MNKTIFHPKASHLRCYQCGSPEIHAVCHHCGRPMCKKHGPVRPKLWWFKENREFEGLSLGQAPLSETEGAHCHECVHSRWNYKRLLFYPGLVITLIGLVLLVFSAFAVGICIQERCPGSSWRLVLTWVGVGWLLMSTGVAMSGLGWYASQDWMVAQSTTLRPPALPLGPNINRIRVIERFEFAQQWDRQRFRTQWLSALGQGQVLWKWSILDRRRLQEYQDKYKLNMPDIEFNAGHFWLVGAPTIRLLPTRAPVRPWSANLLRWQGKGPRFLKEQSPPDRSARPLFEYQILTDLRDDQAVLWSGGPIRLVPQVLECGEYYRVRFELQFQPAYFPALPSDAWARVQMLHIEIDSSRFGQPQAQSGMKHQSEDGKHTWITWENFLFQPAQSTIELPWEMVLNKPPAQADTTITGQLQIYVPALISGLKGVRYFNALGYPFEVSFEGSTVLVMEFQAELAALAVPCEQQKPCVWRCDFGREPDHALYQQLLQALICGPGASRPCPPRPHWQILRVEAEPPRLAEQERTVHRWYWEIWGRRYWDTLPIEFHIALYGDQVGHLEVTVHGQVFDERSRQAVEETMREIQIAVQQVLPDFCPAGTAEHPCETV